VGLKESQQNEGFANELKMIKFDTIKTTKCRRTHTAMKNSDKHEEVPSDLYLVPEGSKNSRFTLHYGQRGNSLTSLAKTTKFSQKFDNFYQKLNR